MRRSHQAPPPEGLAVFRRLLDLALPIIGLNVLAVLALAVDTAMLGRLSSAEAALTGLGYATQLAFLLMVAMIGLTVGTVAFVARAHGAGDADRINHILGQSTTLTLLLGVLVAVGGNILAEPLIELLGGSGQSKEAALAYLRPTLVGVVFSYLVILYGAVLRGVGNTRLAFFVALVTNGLNVVFNYSLIFGNFGMPELGIQGAAIGTVSSQFVGAVILNRLLNKGVIEHLCAPLRPRPIDRELARDLLRIGLPAAMDMLVLNAGFLSIVGMLGRIDQLAVAAHGMGLRVQALAFVPGLGVAQATGALVGQALGAEDIEGAKRVVRSSLVLTVTMMSLIAAVLYVGAPALVSLFDVAPGTPLSDFTVTWMRLLGVCMPVVGVYIAFVGMFQGSGATRLSLRINIGATLLFQIPASWVLGFPLGLSAFGVWLAFPLAFCLKAIAGTVEYKRGAWAQTGKTV